MVLLDPLSPKLLTEEPRAAAFIPTASTGERAVFSGKLEGADAALRGAVKGFQ